MKVEELAQYGKAPEIPDKVLKQQKRIFFRLLRKEFGFFGNISLKIKLKKQTDRINKQFSGQIENIKKAGKNMDKQLVMIASLYFTIANKRGRSFARKIMARMMQKVAPVSIPAIYPLNELVNCDGDVFSNYKKFNRAMFTKINQNGTLRIREFKETEDLLEFEITSYSIIEFFDAIGCPEIGALGCEHYLAGYPLIEEATQSEFRRPCTPVKGGEYCYFQFYRKGTAPDNVHLNK